MDSKQRDPEEILSLREISVKVARSAELQTDRATAPAPARPSRFSRPGAALARECARCKPKSPGSKDSAYTGTCAVWGADFPGGAEAAGSAPVVPCLEARRGRRGLCPGDRGGALLPRARVPHRPLVCPMPTRFLRALAHASRVAVRRRESGWDGRDDQRPPRRSVVDGRADVAAGGAEWVFRNSRGDRRALRLPALPRPPAPRHALTLLDAPRPGDETARPGQGFLSSVAPASQGL